MFDALGCRILRTFLAPCSHAACAVRFDGICHFRTVSLYECIGSAHSQSLVSVVHDAAVHQAFSEKRHGESIVARSTGTKVTATSYTEVGNFTLGSSGDMLTYKSAVEVKFDGSGISGIGYGMGAITGGTGRFVGATGGVTEMCEEASSGKFKCEFSVLLI